MPVRESVRNNKTCNGSHLFPAKRIAESGRGVYALLSGIESGMGEKSPWISKNDGTDGTGISLFLHPVYFIQFLMLHIKQRS